MQHHCGLRSFMYTPAARGAGPHWTKNKAASWVGHLCKNELSQTFWGLDFSCQPGLINHPSLLFLSIWYTQGNWPYHSCSERNLIHSPIPQTEPDMRKLWPLGAFYQVEQEVSQGEHCIILTSSEKKTLFLKSLPSSMLIPQTQKTLTRLGSLLPEVTDLMWCRLHHHHHPNPPSMKGLCVTGQPEPARLNIHI